MIRTDLWNRGVPWTRLLVQQGAMTRTETLNLRPIEKVKTALASAALVCVALALLTRESGWLVAAVLSLLVVMLGSVELYAFFTRVRGWRFAFAVVPLHLLYYAMNGVAAGVGWLLHHIVGEPRPDPAIEAYVELGVMRDPPVPPRSRSGT